ncbi:MAG: XRE family transcriptional regulator [Thiobacillus sp.]|uniref:MbcA/ParS/Xre antitoxin family protein n=1 Tax=Thiobacillus sp. TaxID=924 RepID=UPI002893BDB1|nr:XRE family transcriptional regulator [Thiobacillus sp.]MDT3708311.1 XRE family transcriptional regulator [Thiobacillus sp.]
MSLAVAHHVDQADVLAEALVNAGRQLGMSQADLGEIIGKDRTAISRGRIDPGSKAGELALLFIRCYRALYVLVGGNVQQMRHWMETENLHTGGIPAEQVKSVQGLTGVLEYLDAMRGKL